MSTRTTPARRFTSPDLPGSPSLARLVAGGLVVGLLVLVVAMFVGGAAPQPSPAGLPSAGAGTGWALPVARLLSDLAAIVTIGLLLTAAVLVPARAGQLKGAGLRLAAWAGWTGLVWVLAVALQTALTLSDVTGVPLPQALQPDATRAFLTQILQGQALAVELLGAAAVAVSCRWLLTTSGAALALLVGQAAFLVPALAGHSGASSQHDVAVSSLMIHEVSASLWVGGLAGLVALALVESRLLRTTVPRFSAVAVWCYAALGLSGAANAWIRLDGPADLVTTGYGRLVLVKTVLLVALGYAGWRHRTSTIPALLGPRRTRAFVRLAVVELGLMTAAVSVGVALSRTPTPVVVADLTGVTPARALLGFDLPPYPTWSRLLVTEVRPDALFLALALLGCALYVTGLRRLAARKDSWPVGRSISWFGGMALLAWATSGGIGTYAHVLFSAHMVQHMVLVTVAPILMVLGAPTTLALRVLPAHRDERGPREWLLAVLASWPVRILTNPLVATALFIGGFYGLYFTSLFPHAMANHWGHLAMNVHFVASGYLFFWVLIGIDPGPRRIPYPARLLLLVVAMPFHAFFNIAILSSTSVLGGDYFAALRRPYFVDLLADQRVGASIGWATGEIPLILVVVVLTVQWIRSDEREARRFDRAADRAAAGTSDVPDELAAYNAYLAGLNRPAERRAPDRGDTP